MDEFSSPPIPRARILVVEDEATTRKAVARALNLTGYQADEAVSGEQALAKLSVNSYDLMLLDLRMPGMDGVEVMKRVQGSHPDLLVIVLTAYATVDSAITAVQIGAVDYLLKPAKIREIEIAISRALERRRDQLHRQHLIGVIADALDALQTEEQRERATPFDRPDRFIQHGPITLDRQKRLAVVSGGDATPSFDAELTGNETSLLAYFMQHPETVISSRELAQHALGYDVDRAEAKSIVRPHISRLRKKIEPSSTKPCLIRTVRGKGYLFAPD